MKDKIENQSWHHFHCWFLLEGKGKGSTFYVELPV